MTATAQDLIDRASILLQDEDNVRWGHSELLGWLNEGQLMIINLQPSAYSEQKVVTLDPGTKQTLPDGNIRLLDVIRNQDGVYNTSIRVVSRIDLDTQVPNWHMHKPNRIIQHYMYDVASPDIFYVYPPVPEPKVDQNGDTLPHTISKVEILHAVEPPVLDDMEDTIALKDIYVPALVDYIVFRAYSKDAEASPNQNLKNMYYQQFLNGLGLQNNANRTTAA